MKKEGKSFGLLIFSLYICVNKPDGAQAAPGFPITSKGIFTIHLYNHLI